MTLVQWLINYAHGFSRWNVPIQHGVKLFPDPEPQWAAKWLEAQKWIGLGSEDFPLPLVVGGKPSGEAC